MSHPPVVFIHGLWIHSSAWAPWIELFAQHGYEASAPGWPGDRATVEATRLDPGALEDVGIEAIYRHYADILETYDTKPIVIGHSFGGLIAQELLANDLVVAAVAIDPAPIKGVKVLPFSQLKAGFPVLANPANRGRTVALKEKQFRYAFGNAISEEESRALFERWTIPGPGRPLFEDAAANFSRRSAAKVNTETAERGPLLLTSGTEDHLVPQAVTVAVAKLYADNTASTTEYHEFRGKGHSLTLDGGWKDVASDILGWLESKRISSTPQSAAH